MSTDFHSNNPFRRKATAISPSVENQVPQIHDAFAQPSSFPSTSILNSTDQIRVQTRQIKKVRVQSPAPSSPEGESIPQKPPTPIPRDDGNSKVPNDPFEILATNSSNESDDETETVRDNYILPNPFQKTLATLEHADRKSFYDLPQATTSSIESAGRASLDVEAFKRLLMTGSSGLAGSQSSASPPVGVGHGALNDGGSSTDASSSASRQSIFEPIQETLLESPRTSHEVSDPDDERGRFATEGLVASDRRKPAPPSSRHGKLIKVELRDELTPYLGPSVEAPSPLHWRGPQPAPINSSSIQSRRSTTDLNKPLPEAPTRASHELDHDSVFDKEAAGKIPEPLSPPSSVQRKTPPAPPLSRRRSQLVSDSKPTRALSARLSSKMEDGSGLSDPSTAVTQPSTSKGPPPPPVARRPASIRNISYQESQSSPALSSHEAERLETRFGSAPPPPQTRTPSTRQPGRPSSVLSIDLTSKRSTIPPPPPPPPRKRASSRASTEAPIISSTSSRRTSGDGSRKSIDSTRGDTMVPQPNIVDNSAGDTGAKTILANLSALQREVDALRGQYETRGVS